MKEWPDVILLMARAAQAAQEQPSTERAAPFQALMSDLRKELGRIVDSGAAPGEASNPEGDKGIDENN